MTNSKLQMALQEAATLEFSGIPTHEGDITYNFSDDFLRKMDVLTKSERRVFWRISNTARKRVALVFLVVLLLGLAACSIPAVREKLAGFIVTIFDSHATVSNEGHGTNEITERYVITEVPEGFVQVDVGETSSFIVTTYCHPDGSKIIFSQSVGDEYSLTVDSEHGVFYEANVDGLDVLVYEASYGILAVWKNADYAFDMALFGNIDIDTVISIISSIKIEDGSQ